MTHVRYPLTLWRMGDAIWLTIGGEPYNVLQRHLRQRLRNTISLWPVPKIRNAPKRRR